MVVVVQFCIKCFDSLFGCCWEYGRFQIVIEYCSTVYFQIFLSKWTKKRENVLIYGIFSNNDPKSVDKYKQVILFLIIFSESSSFIDWSPFLAFFLFFYCRHSGVIFSRKTQKWNFKKIRVLFRIQFNWVESILEWLNFVASSYYSIQLHTFMLISIFTRSLYENSAFNHIKWNWLNRSTWVEKKFHLD